MRAAEFWQRGGWPALALAPAGWLYGLAGRPRAWPARPADPAATPARYAKWRGTLQILPVDRVVPLALEEVLQREFGFDAAELDPGGNAPAPRLIFIDLDGDGLEDAMLLSGTLRGDPQMVRDSRYLLRVGDEWRLVPRGGTTRR